ncbi:MAG: 3-keto-disaccharide hydrolase [Woeseiaceae bacterium]
MTGKTSLIHGTIVLIALLLSPGLPAAERPEPGFADPLLGRWDLTVNGPGGAYPSWLEIRLRTEWALMAQLVGQFGSARHATAVSLENGELKIRVPAQYEEGDEDLVFAAIVKNGELEGTVKGADGKTFNWHANRAPALERSDVSEWGEPVSLIGDNLDGWRPRNSDYPGCWTVSDGVLKATPPCVDIVSEALFDDFRLQLEFRYPPGSNSGVYLRGRYELQIQDDLGKVLDPLRLGGIYGFMAPKVDAALGPGEWQTYDILLVGRRVTVSLNGTEVLSNRVIPGITGGALDSNEANPGPLMLQGDHGPIEFRNVVITPGR